MKTILFEASLNGITEQEKVDFSTEELSLFISYVQNYERLTSSHIFESELPTLESLSICSDKGITYKVSDFDKRDLHELLHVLRPFILKKEPASFENTLTIFRKRLSKDLFRKHFRMLGKLYSDSEHSFIFQLSVDKTRLFNDHVFSNWLNGYEYHGDVEKQEFIKQLEETFEPDMIMGIMLSMVKSKIKAIKMLKIMVSVALKDDAT